MACELGKYPVSARTAEVGSGAAPDGGGEMAHGQPAVRFLRLMECLRLRVKDIDFGYAQIVVRDGKMKYITVLLKWRT